MYHSTYVRLQVTRYTVYDDLLLPASRRCCTSLVKPLSQKDLAKHLIPVSFHYMWSDSGMPFAACWARRTPRACTVLGTATILQLLLLLVV